MLLQDVTNGKSLVMTFMPSNGSSRPPVECPTKKSLSC